MLGPLADKTGRRRLLLSMMMIFAVTAFFEMNASSILVIQFCRFSQGFASGGFFVVNQAMIRESYDTKMLPRITAMVTIAWALMSLLSPLCGGYMQKWYTWRESFLLILTYVSLIFIFIYFFLPETLDKSKRSICMRLSLSDLKYLWHTEGFTLSAFLASLTYSIIFIFYTTSPFLFQDYLSISPVFYAWVLFAAGGAYLFGGVLNSLFCVYLSTALRLKIGMIGVFSCVCFFVLVY